MIDFLMISTRSKKNGLIEIYPKFIIKKSSDLMIRGGDFYAIWIEERGLWSTDEQDALQLIDRELDRYAEENRNRFDSNVKVLHMWDSESGMIDSWHKYCQKQMRDSFHMLDEKLIFSNTPTNKKDYASKRLGYPLEAGETPAYDKLMSTLYEEEERRKIEWAIGSIISGESKKLQKFMVLYGAAGTGKSTVLNFRLVGFNCRRYDNHILYARLIGYDNEQLFNLSQKIIGGSANCFFGEAYNVSYTDVYDFCSKKQSLKKWEIELGLHHQELGLPWDQPVPEELWPKVAEYCDNDVIATEAVFNERRGDFAARQILAKLANGCVNDTTNSLSAKIIFGNNRKPQDQFNYRDLSQPVPETEYRAYRKKFGEDYIFRIFDEHGLPTYETYKEGALLPKGYSILPFFPGYKYENGKSTFMGDEIGEGGRVFSRPGMYGNAWDGDIASQHPSSAIAEVLFGVLYTKRFEEIKEARVAIKHHDYAKARTMLDGALVEYIDQLENGTAWFTAEDLAQALKIVINSVYGLTAANFENPFRDPRNKDNIVAKRGALFMTLLKSEVEKRGFCVAHIKTDSIKIPDATPEIMDFVIRFGKEYGYLFETEANFEKFCLVNDAVYVAKFKDGKHAGEWTATGTQFQVPYVFKKLFSKEPIEFKDMCETKSVASALYLDMNENLPDVSEQEKDLERIVKKAREFGVDMDTSGHSGDSELDSMVGEISKGHNYIFIGKVGQFCPIKPGCGGGLLMRETENKKTGEKGYAAAASSKGYRWLESEMVRELGKEESIDLSYYDNMVTEAVKTISQYGDFEWFVSDDPYVPDTPPWQEPSEPWNDRTPYDVR